MVFSLFRSGAKKNLKPLKKDVHSHLLAGIDDGVPTIEDALRVVRGFIEAGYTGAVTTPHIIQDYYRNDPHIIREGLRDLRAALAAERIEFEVDAAAEYYLDEALSERIATGEELLTFGSRYLLFETNMINEPFSLKDFIFKLSMSGYKPVLAHPERYNYMTIDKAEDMRNRGVLLQINALSLIGYYSRPVQRLAFELIDRGWIDFIGSDCHNLEHVVLLREAQQHKYFQKALDLPLLNHTL